MPSTKSLNVAIVLLVVTLGVAAVVAGGYDDSPGLQLIGVMLVAGAALVGWRTVRRS